MAIDNAVNLSQVANQYQKNDILTKTQKYQVNPNAVDKTPDKDTVQLSSGLTTKEKVGIAAVATTIVAGALAILGRNGHLGKSVQKFLGGKAKKAAQEMGEHTHTPNAHVEPKPTVKPEPEPTVKPEPEPTVKSEPEPNVKVEQETKAKAEQEAKAKAEQEAKAKAEQEAKAKAEQEAKAKAEQEAKAKAEQEAKAKAEQEAKAKAEQEAKTKAEQEAKAKAEQEAKAKTEQEAKAKAEQEAKAKAEQEAKAKAEQEAKAKAEQEAKAKAEQEAIRKAEREAEIKARRLGFNYADENMEELDKLFLDKNGNLIGKSFGRDSRKCDFKDLVKPYNEELGILYHGTTPEAKEKILTEGFRQDVPISHGYLDGVGGTYFALDLKNGQDYGSVVKAKFKGKVAHLNTTLVEYILKPYLKQKTNNLKIIKNAHFPDSMTIEDSIVLRYLQNKLKQMGYDGIVNNYSFAAGCQYFSALDPSLIQIIK